MTMIIMAALGTFYVTYALTYTEGIGGSFEKLAQFKYSPTHCFTCTAVWVGLFFALLLWAGLDWAIIPFGLAGAAQALHNMTR